MRNKVFIFLNQSNSKVRRHSPAGIILLSTLWIYKKGRTLLAKVISSITFNAAFILISLHIGDQGGTYLYYFPFILAYIYLFRASGKPVYTWIFTLAWPLLL